MPEKPGLAVFVTRDQTSVGSYHTPPGKPVTGGQNVPHRTRSPRETRLFRYLSVGRDLAGAQTVDGGEHPRFESARHAGMLSEPIACKLIAVAASSVSGPRPLSALPPGVSRRSVGKARRAVPGKHEEKGPIRPRGASIPAVPGAVTAGCRHRQRSGIRRRARTAAGRGPEGRHARQRRRSDPYPPAGGSGPGRSPVHPQGGRTPR